MNLRTLANAYDRSADGYDDRFRALQRVKYAAAFELLARRGRLPAAGARILDAGGGTGLLAEWAREQGHAWRFVVLDASLGMLRKAQERGLPAVAADLARPPLRAQFPLVVAFTSVLDRVPTALSRLQALVAPGGALVCSFLRAEAPALHVAARVDAGQDTVVVLEAE